MRRRKILKVFGIVLLTLAILFTGFHFWFINRSVSLLENFVTDQSKGKYQLHIQKLRYNYARLIFQLEKPQLICLDSASDVDKYDVSAEILSINLKQLLPLVFKKELRFDSVFVNEPNIRITHQKAGSTASETSKEVNISADMFRTYSSLQNVLGQLQVDKFSIRNGAFTIANTVDTSQQQPLKIGGINFTIKGLNIKPTETPNYDPLAITDSVGLAIAGQRIVFPDGKRSVAFKSFSYNSVLGEISLDSFQVISRSDTTANNFNVFAEKLALKKFRLVSRNGTDFTQIDSVFFTRPIAKLILETKTGKAKKDSADNIATTLRKVVGTVTGNGAINYIGINNVNFDITTLKNNKESRFFFVQDKLEIGEVLLNKDSIAPVTVGSLRFGLKRYVNYFNDSAYFIQFDSIRILDGQLALYNFELQSTPKAPQIQKINIPVLMLSGFDWYRFIFEKHVALKSIALYDPQITISAPAKGSPKSGNAGFDFQKQFSVDHVILQKANIKVLFSKNEYAQVKDLSMNANTAPWFRRPNIASAMAMLQGTNATELLLQKSGWDARIGGPKLNDSGIALFPHLKIVNKQKQIKAYAENVRIARLQVNEQANRVSIGNISWQSIDVDMLLPEKKGNKKDSAGQPSIHIAGINGGQVKLHLHNAKTDASADLTALHTGKIAVNAGKLDTLKDFSLKGKSWKLLSTIIEASGSSFHIVDQQTSEINDVQVKAKPQGEIIDAAIPQISFVGDMLKIANQQMVFESLKVHKPKATVIVSSPSAADKSNTQAAQSFPLIQLQKAEILNPEIDFMQLNGQSNQTILKLHLADAYFSTGVFSSGNEFNLQNVVLQSSNLSFNKNDSLLIGLSKGKLNLSVGNFGLYKKAPDVWKFSEAALTLTNAELKAKGDSGKRDTLIIPSFVVKHFAASASTVKNWRTLVLNQPQLQLQNVTLRYRNKDNIFMVDDLNTTLGSNKISMASFFYHPQLAEEAFIKTHYYETDFIRTKTGRLTIYNIDRQAFIKDSIVRIRHISIDDVDFRDTRDKTPPFKANVIKPLPVSLIKKIPFPIDIDSVTLQKANITYKEVSEKTGQPGTIYFTRTDSKFINIKNRNLTVRDTFQWNSSAYMMDSMPFFLSIKSAYKDSLDKLYLTVRLSPTNIALLNPFFAPLEGISFKSGNLETLELNVVANDYIGHGTMKFFYNDLHIEFLNPSDTTKKGFFKSVITFLANKLVLKKNNHHRIGTVYFERIRDRSIFNYIVKLTVNGMKSSIGAQKNSKMEKAYEKKLMEMGWKPLEE